MMNCAQFAERGAAPALLEDGTDRWLDYRGLTQAVGAAADRLGDRPLVFLFTGLTIAGCVAYLACLEAGAPTGLFGAGLPPGRADALIRLYRPHLVVGHAPEAGYAEVAGQAGWYRRLGDDAPVPHPDLALLLSTSGSTGSPKLVRLSRHAIDSNAAAIVRSLGIAPNQRSVLNLPFSYSYGLSVLNSHLAAGASVLLTREGLTGAGFWQRLAAHQVTSMPGVPMVYEMLRRLGFENLAPPSLVTLTQAGGKLAAPLIRHFSDIMTARGGRFFVMYGATEAAPRMAVLRAPEKLGAVGRAIPGGRFEIEDGEIIYHGPNVMLGYAESAQDLTLGDRLSGRLATGDLGHLDDDGVLWITGRAKRIAKVNGLRFNLDEVEALVTARFAPAAVIAADERLTLLIEADDRRSAEIRRDLATALALPPASVRIQCVARLPLSENGKIDRDAVGRLVA
ncbi:MAG: AMP-dependent synthetase and ligase [Rhodospirillales bacterium]|nr:AMP-dependent synthetase and ligase [Rhodospirillales bacterium]